MDDNELVNDAKEREENPTPISRVGGSQLQVIKKTGGLIKKKGASIAIAAILVVALIAIALLTPSFMIGTVKENLTGTLGYKDTVAVLNKQGKYVTSEMLALGKVPGEYAERLAAAGIETGQVNSVGQFVRTNTYIANIDDVQVAAEGEYNIHGDDGELVVRYNDEIITADRLVARIDEEPRLYAAYEDAANLSALYYHGSDVAGVLKDMGLSGGSFANFQNTGDAKADEEQFNEIMKRTLDTNGKRSIGGTYWEWEWICPETDDGSESDCYWKKTQQQWECNGIGLQWDCLGNSDDPEVVANGLVEYVAAHSRRDDASGTSPNENAAQNLNALLSSEEPYRAAIAFMATMEAIEKAQIGDNGPVNEMMNALMKPTEITYYDVSTGELKTEKKSILESRNFYAALADGEFSIDEASSFSRDRILMATNLKSDVAIKDTGLSIDGIKKAGDGLIMDNLTEGDNEAASVEALTGVANALRIALTEENSELFSSVVGANRILEGGSLIMNMENRQLIGALPSTEAKVLAYQQEVDVELARMAEAERATKSPFDVSSPNTFLGALMRKAAVATIGLHQVNGGLASGISGFIGELTRGSFQGFVLPASADGTGERFSTTIGNGDTVPVVGAVTDLYGTEHDTPYTGKMNLTEEQWKEILPSGTFTEDGEIKKTSDLAFQIATSNDREATVGVRNYEVCRKYNDAYDEQGGLFSFARTIVSAVTRAFDLVNECDMADNRYGSDDMSTGKTGVLGTEENQNALNSGYLLYDEVKSLLSGTKSKAMAFRGKYYGDETIARE